MEVFCSLHQSIVACMESICDDGPTLWTRDALTDARSLLIAITTTNFISTLVVTNQIPPGLDIQSSNRKQIHHSHCGRVILMLRNSRDNIDTHHSCWFSTVEKMWGDVGTEPSVPRRCIIDAVFLPALRLCTTAIHYSSL